MNRRITTKAKVTLFALLVVAILICIINAGSYYTRKGTVTWTNGQVIEVVDKTGQTWEIECQGHKTGDEVVLSMHDHGTTSTADDTVRTCKH